MPRYAVEPSSSRSSTKRMTLLAAIGCGCLGLLGLSVLGCNHDDGELIGFGKYKIGKTTPADDYVMGKCRPEGSNTFCFLNRSPSIAGHKTQTDLYFRGHEEDAPLIEISVGVWDCQVGAVRSDLRGKLGKPTQNANKRSLWVLKKMTVIALLPKDDKLCMVHFLENSDSKRISSLFPAPAQTTADVAPADVAPADVAPADVAPADVAPADIAPADIAPTAP